MQYIDFRNEYGVVSITSFSITFVVYLAVSSVIPASPSYPAMFAKFFLSLGLYLAIFKGLLWLYNNRIWRYFGYQDIDIGGYWHYRSYKSTTQTNTEGYAYISQDMYGILIYGFSVGSAGDKKAISMWQTNNVNISRGVLSYEYELFAERPNRVARIMRSKVSLNLYGVPPEQMVGTYIDIPIAAKEDTVIANLVGSMIFMKCNQKELSDVTKNLFDEMMINQANNRLNSDPAQTARGSG